MSRLSARLAWLSLALVACTGPNPDFRRVGAGDARPADASAMADGASEDVAPGEPQDVANGEPSSTPADGSADTGPMEVNGLRGDYFVGIAFDTLAFSQGQIALTVGQRYPIRIEHFDTALTATMRLAWSSPSQPRQIVPSAHLFTAPLP